MRRKFYRYFIYYEFDYTDVLVRGVASTFFDSREKLDNNEALRQLEAATEMENNVKNVIIKNIQFIKIIYKKERIDVNLL